MTEFAKFDGWGYTDSPLKMAVVVLKVDKVSYAKPLRQKLWSGEEARWHIHSTVATAVHARRRTTLTPITHLSSPFIPQPWCCGSSALAFAAVQAFLSNPYRYLPWFSVCKCFRCPLSAVRRSCAERTYATRPATIIHPSPDNCRCTILRIEPVADPARIAHHIEAPHCAVAPRFCWHTQHLPPA